MTIHGFRRREPAAILLSGAVIFPLLFLVKHSLSARVGDSWPLFIWPLAFACTAISYKQWREKSQSLPARFSFATVIFAMVGGIAFVAATEIYYLTGKANVLGKTTRSARKSVLATSWPLPIRRGKTPARNGS